MKRIQLLLCCWCSFFTSTLIAQSNYEIATQIQQVSRDLNLTTSDGKAELKRFKAETNDDEAYVENLAKAIYQEKNNLGSLSSFETTPNPAPENNGNGVLDQPVIEGGFEMDTGSNQGNQQQQTQDNPMAIERIKKELKAVSNLIDADPDQICNWANGTEVFPDQFQYLEAMAAVLATKSNNIGVQTAFDATGASGVFSIAESEIIQGIVEWSVNRAKEELMQAFLQEWLERIENDPFLQELFPNTLNLLATSDITTVISQGETWKSTFMSDFDRLPLKMPSAIDYLVSRYSDIQDTEKTELLGFLRVSVRLFDELNKSKQLSEIIPILSAEIKLDANARSYIEKGILGTDIFLRNIKTEASKFLKPTTVLEMSESEFKIFWNLIFIKNYDKLKIIFPHADCKALYNKTIGRLDQFKLHLAKVSDVFLNLKELEKKLNTTTKGDKKLELADANDYFRISFDLTDQAVDIANSLGLMNTQLENAYKHMIKPIGEQIMEINDGIATKEYGKVVTNTIGIVQTLKTQTVKAPVTVGMSDDEKKKAEEAFEKKKKSYDEVAHYINNYGKFMVNLLTAEGKDDVKEAFEEAAMKTGGYMVKQTSRFSTIVTFYPGVVFGREVLRKDGQQFVDMTGAKDQSEGSYFGATLPIGIELAWGYKNKGLGKVFGSQGIFLQALDLGAVLNFSINNPDSVAVASDFGFKEVLAPGAYFVTHFRKCPITLGFGASYTPSLREVNQDAVTFKANALQIGVFLSVDVSVFTLYASNRKINPDYSRLGL